jgi:hypothetical protein
LPQCDVKKAEYDQIIFCAPFLACKDVTAC